MAEAMSYVRLGEAVSQVIRPQLVDQGESNGKRWYLVRMDVPAGK